jgi:FdrA protein
MMSDVVTRAVKEIIIRPNEYFDSMVLMQVNHRISAMPGIVRAGIMMATDMNKKLLALIGFHNDDVEVAQAGDMLIGIEAESREYFEAAIATLDNHLSGQHTSRASRSKRFGSLAAAAKARPEANLAVISVPGAYAAREAHKALDLGLNCFLFSDNVTLEEELALKRKAKERDLLVMGPDCGTAVIDGAALGFANAVPRGPVGVIGASGTGIQEFTVLLDRLAGQGITQAIGLGGRDLSPEVDGMSAVKAFNLLGNDPVTRCIVFITKPPSPEVVSVVARAALDTGKPIVFCLLEPDTGEERMEQGIFRVSSLEDAVWRTMVLLGLDTDGAAAAEGMLVDKARRMARELKPGQRYMRGVFSGGSLCLEVMAYLAPRLGECYANIRMPGVFPLSAFAGSGHCFWDMGDDEFTQGRVHPMIDPGLVAESIVREAARPNVGVVVLDVVLGYGVNPDPASILGPAVEKARSLAAGQGRVLHVLAHVCGTDKDPQNAKSQEERMRQAGAVVVDTNLQLGKLAVAIVKEA